MRHSKKGSQLTDPNPHRVKDSNIHGKISWKEAIGTIPLFFTQTFLPILSENGPGWKKVIGTLSCMAEFYSTQAQEDLKGWHCLLRFQGSPPAYGTIL
ncbi:MAG TPA: hypothetical protein DEO65_00400 [Bacillus bacterium]|uniref:hypothetical protein n=1 Tax=Siminovitchia fordii TaxID=254759 RepID=UPI000371B4D9|nr:hypothetical protein [Siminovitchia fordii]HBZ08325.1 hypothetical protein [Bacillus sp. (in: firmicutes)]